MANIYINDKIRLNRKGLQALGFDNKWADLHCEQGSLDGACVVYSTIMALLTEGYLSSDDIDIFSENRPSRRSQKGKLISYLLEEQGLLRDGYSLRTMTQDLRKYLDGYIINHHTKDVPERAIEYIESDIPVILRVVSDTGMDHAIFAIGTEYMTQKNDEEKLLKLFCLDPGYDKDKTAYWNCVIDTSRTNAGDYPYWYITDEQTLRVDITEIITIVKEETDD